jgi:prohibitin 1
MKKFALQVMIASAFIFITESCVVVGPNQVGVKQRLGRLDDNVYQSGPVAYNPFVTKVLVIDINTKNMEVAIGLPSKEGLTINAVVSVLYRINPDKVKELLTNTGLGFEQSVIFPVFRSAAADVSARFYAKDLHSGERQEIEREIKEKMALLLESRGIIVEAILMKSITLPEGLSKSIEEKLQAEQQVERMEFELEQEKLEAQRKIIEAEGIRDAQLIIAEGLNDTILMFKSIEALEKLYTSPNAKIILTNGTSPFILNAD